ncbi:MAG: enoyl-CoA hydratase [Rhodobacteraceae bacterium]|nr:enoyl-CoA hydratase [Paracoccaceae bacterium]MAY47832.1 enoyl-CoA hydratase [Paracoccaceae bacterium]
MKPQHIRVSQTGPVARITLDAPGRNAMSIPMQEQIRAALASLADDIRVRVLLIEGANGAFCSGAALDGLKGDDNRSLGEVVAGLMDDLSNPMIREIRAFPHPVVAVVTGAAAGAGASIALAADITIAAESGFFLFPFAPKLGLIPDLGANWTLVQRLGEARAMGVALLGGRLPARTAAEWGLIWAAVPDEGLDDAVRALCDTLTAAPPGMVGSLRALFGAARDRGFDALLDIEARRQAKHLDSPAFDEGRRAFLEKRAPEFHRA